MSKKTKTDGKKDGKKKAEVPVKSNDDNEKLLAFRQSEILKHRLAMQENLMVESEAVAKDSRAKMIALSQAFEQEKKQHFEILADMTRQYKSMREELLRKIADSEEKDRKNMEVIASLQSNIASLKSNSMQELALKQAEIAEYQSKMETMTTEFANMLKSVLEKMTEKINIENAMFEKNE